MDSLLGASNGHHRADGGGKRERPIELASVSGLLCCGIRCTQAAVRHNPCIRFGWLHGSNQCPAALLVQILLRPAVLQRSGRPGRRTAASLHGVWVAVTVCTSRFSLLLSELLLRPFDKNRLGSLTIVPIALALDLGQSRLTIYRALCNTWL